LRSFLLSYGSLFAVPVVIFLSTDASKDMLPTDLSHHDQQLLFSHHWILIQMLNVDVAALMKDYDHPQFGDSGIQFKYSSLRPFDDDFMHDAAINVGVPTEPSTLAFLNHTIWHGMA